MIIEQFREGKITRMTDSIQQHFLLSKELAEFVNLLPILISRKYSRFIFLCYHRIETTDKRLKFLSASDLEFFASCLMSQWTIDDAHLELDRKFKEVLIYLLCIH